MQIVIELFCYVFTMLFQKLSQAINGKKPIENQCIRSTTIKGFYKRYEIHQRDSHMYMSKMNRQRYSNNRKKKDQHMYTKHNRDQTKTIKCILFIGNANLNLNT